MFRINGKKVSPVLGYCTTYNIVYCIQCTLCNMCYVGRSVRRLNERIGEHRRGYYKIINNNMLTSDLHREDDEFAVGYHLVDKHNLKSQNDFSNVY